MNNFPGWSSADGWDLIVLNPHFSGGHYRAIRAMTVKIKRDFFMFHVNRQEMTVL
jgi:hypothetical protein